MLKTGRIVFVVLFLQLTYFNSFSQDENKSQAVYLELGGSGGYYTMNFDTRFTSKANGWGGRIGIGYFPTLFGPGGVTYVPLVINYLKGEKKHFLEVGAGATYLSFKGNFLGIVSYAGSGLIGNLAIGYRRVSDSGFTFRGGLTPLIGRYLDPGSLFMPQVSFGYSF